MGGLTKALFGHVNDVRCWRRRSRRRRKVGGWVGVLIHVGQGLIEREEERVGGSTRV